MKNLARVGVLALTAGLLAVVPTAANADTEVLVYKNQITQPDTRSAGHVSWPVGGGIRLITDDNTSNAKATAVYPLGANSASLDSGPISHDVSVKSGGEQATPGVQIYVGADANDATPGALFVYEEVYGDDIWLTNFPESPEYRVAAPSCDSSTEENKQLLRDADTPAERDALINTGVCTGGGGSAFHGSQTAWTSNLQAAGLNYIVVALGESLGSGVKGNVLVSSITQGTVTYEFTRANAPVVTPDPVVVTPQSKLIGTITATCRRAVVHVELPALNHADEVYSTPSIKIRVASKGTTVPGSQITLNEGQVYDKTLEYPKSSGSPVVKIFHSMPQVEFRVIAVRANCNTVGAAPVTSVG